MQGTATNHRAATRWMDADAFAASGWTPERPEIDYGMRWGDEHTIRVSFAPFASRPGGYLYAYNKITDQYLLLAPHTTVDQAERVRSDLRAYLDSPDAYLTFATLDHGPGPMNLEPAQELFLGCLEKELGAYRTYIDCSGDGSARFDAAFNVIVQRSARVSSERLLLDAAEGASADGRPVVVSYRLLEESGWTGKLAGSDLEDARRTTRRAFDLAERHLLAFQATSVSHGHTTVSAARVPEFGFSTVYREMTIGASGIGI